MRQLSPSGGSISGFVLAAVVVAAATLAAKLLERIVALPDPAMVFLAGVLFTAVAGGLGPSLFASLASFLVYDFLFVDPLYTFTVTKPQDVVSLFVFLIVAVLTSQLMARIRDQAETARQREAHTAALYSFSREIAAAAGIDDLRRVIVTRVADLFRAEVVMLTPEEKRLALQAAHPAGTKLAEAEEDRARRVWRHEEPAGAGGVASPGGEWLYVPLDTARGVVGVLGLRGPVAGGFLPLDQRLLLEALARQAAMAIERMRIDAVLEEKAKTEQVMEASEDGLIVLDPAGVVAHVNEVACAILGVDRAEAIASRFEDLTTTHSHYLRLRGAVREFLEHPERDRERVEITLFLRGRDHHYVLRPTPFRTRDGSPAGLILVLQDVTYLRDQEARRENLLATLSHELGTPLTSLRMAVELLGREVETLDPGQRELVDTAHEDVVRLQDVAQRFLDLARTRAMSISLERRSLDLGEVASRVVKLFALQAREKNIQLELATPGSEVVSGDETKLSWALSNLIGNALRYTPAGGRVAVDIHANGGAVLVSVSDSGPGIPPEQREWIFERFAQSPESGAVGSAGLGLAIVRDIVQAHGGRIHLESAVGKGTCFTLELPRS